MRSRLILFVSLLILWVAGISARLYHVQITNHETYRERAENQHQRVIKVYPPRGTIYDARGRALAVSVTADSACLFPRELQKQSDPSVELRRLGRVLGIDEKVLADRVSPNSQFVWVKRLLEPEQTRALRDLEIRGLGFVEESKRYYPMGELAAPVLGFVGTDHTGLAGLEAQYEKSISGTVVRRTVIQDALYGLLATPELSFSDAEPGEDLFLTLDATIQHIVERELESAVHKHGAKTATAVVLDPWTGGVLAMASYPGFDPNDFERVERARWRNRAVQDVYEPGSTFKLITAASALERNLIDPVDVLDCEMGAIQLERTRIRDHKAFGLLTFGEVFAKSSNVGAIKTGLLVGREGLYEQVRRFGFGQVTGVDLPGEEPGILRPVEKWSRHEDAYVSIGQGVSITVLQLASAFAAVANGGELLVPYVVDERGVGGKRRTKAPEKRSVGRVATPATVRTLLRLLEAVVEEGTGRRAAVPGHSVAGKTGTAQKAVDGSYSQEKHVASFAGFAPSRRPVLTVVVAIDEPQDQFHGGDVAAPVFSAIVRQSLAYLKTPPEAGGAASPFDAFLVADRTSPREETSRSDGRLERHEVRRARPGVIPDFSGMTARRAILVGSELGLETRLHGSGVVRTQAPAAGIAREGTGGVVEIWLASRS